VSEESRTIDPQTAYVALAADGHAQVYPGGDEFWSQPEGRLERIGEHWLVSEYSFDADWPTWEMHPEADEFVYLLEGEADMLLELAAGPRIVRLSDRGAVVVPRNIWHTAKIRRACRMLHVTMGKGTQTRPA